MTCLRLIALLLCSAAALAAQTLPAGTALPIMLNTAVNANSSKAGDKLEGKLMQEVSLPSGGVIKKQAHVSGHVVEVDKPAGSGSRVVVAFDQIEDEKKAIRLNVGLRALAQSLNVFNAGIPIDTNSDFESADEWVTRQIGGEVVFRGRGYVASDQGKVGKWSGSGVWGKLTPAGDCGAEESNDQEQALWIFSTTACGLYGFEHMTLAHTGTTNPVGQIALVSTGDLEVRSGSGWLLLVNASAPATASPTK